MTAYLQRSRETHKQDIRPFRTFHTWSHLKSLRYCHIMLSPPLITHHAYVLALLFAICKPISKWGTNLHPLGTCIYFLNKSCK
ncbi:unnamed protein product [Acanthoscelides obtectus]|uniref:Uncharacterized protein n=1 Tax=Acanthoscelides obtectus TaxID=200917 RepID=A0A9P0MF35_ACAOB|nr:unnamed protein product [Acanthoscelides obtectus]